VPSFRFRAQPALDLRRREYDVAQRALARADAERQLARGSLEAAGRALESARRQLDDATREPGPRAELDWYRFWIVKLERDRDARRSILDASEAAVVAARDACLVARQGCEALERFRAKAFSAHQAAEAVMERKAIDELASRRFVAERRVREGA
jgi:flagellar export protein FliJ